MKLFTSALFLLALFAATSGNPFKTGRDMPEIRDLGAESVFGQNGGSVEEQPPDVDPFVSGNGENGKRQKRALHRNGQSSSHESHGGQSQHGSDRSRPHGHDNNEQHNNGPEHHRQHDNGPEHHRQHDNGPEHHRQHDNGPERHRQHDNGHDSSEQHNNGAERHRQHDNGHDNNDDNHNVHQTSEDHQHGHQNNDDHPHVRKNNEDHQHGHDDNDHHDNAKDKKVSGTDTIPSNNSRFKRKTTTTTPSSQHVDSIPNGNVVQPIGGNNGLPVNVGLSNQHPNQGPAVPGAALTGGVDANGNPCP